MTTETFTVPGISCQHCVNAIRTEVSALPGITRIEVALATKLVTVAHDQASSTAQIVAAINEAGFDDVVAQ